MLLRSTGAPKTNLPRAPKLVNPALGVIEPPNSTPVIQKGNINLSKRSNMICTGKFLKLLVFLYKLNTALLAWSASFVCVRLYLPLLASIIPKCGILLPYCKRISP